MKKLTYGHIYQMRATIAAMLPPTAAQLKQARPVLDPTPPTVEEDLPEPLLPAAYEDLREVAAAAARSHQSTTFFSSEAHIGNEFGCVVLDLIATYEALALSVRVAEGLLEKNEWAESYGAVPAMEKLEREIGRLVGEVNRLTALQPAAATPDPQGERRLVSQSHSPERRAGMRLEPLTGVERDHG